jgi:hypothetical protein
MGVLYTDPHLGRIFAPRAVGRSISYAGQAVKPAGEVGVFVAKQHRPNIVDMVEQGGILVPVVGSLDLIWASITHNERVDAGAAAQAKQVFGGSGSPGAPSATAYFNVIAHASASLTKAKGDQSLGSTSSGVTTNEFTTIGLARAVATLAGGDYTAPSTLGGTFQQIITKQFTASGSGTVFGAGVFNSTTVVGSILYVEDNYSSTAVLVSGDLLTDTITITN